VSHDGFLVRHGHAGRRGAIDDDRRPLTPRGLRQARTIAATLADRGITRVLTSPYVRCVQTVEPLAARLGTTPEEVDTLGEGHPGSPVLELMAAATAPLVVCSHGDVIGDVLRTLLARGVPLDSDRLDKGGIWVIGFDGTEPVRTRFLPPS
jgi:8-oxo-dGTP diphosphatase